MKKRIARLLTGVALLTGLASCGDAVEVTFQAPFPASSADLPQFRPRDQGRYHDANDTAATLVVGAGSLVRQVPQALRVTRQQLDSLEATRHSAGWLLGGAAYRVTPLAADTFLLSWLRADTLAALAGRQPSRLRQHRGWYYLSCPSVGQPGTWEVSRLRVAGQQLLWQQLGTDTLRLRALDAEAWQVRHEAGLVRITLHPQQRRAIRQLSGYEGLWLPPAQYVRVGS